MPSSSDPEQTKEKRHSEGKASQLWGWLAKRVVARRNSLHISVVSEQEDKEEVEGRSDWLQDQFEGMTYEEIAVWVS